MSKNITLKRGLNIKLKGKAEKMLIDCNLSSTFAVKPPDFQGLTPKMTVKPDAKVKAGDSLFFDKYKPEILFTAPVSGTVKAVNRGERRRILEVVIEPDSQIDYKQFEISDLNSLSKEQVTSVLLESGTWPFIRQRPYAIIANPVDTPKAIFISGFDTAPLAPDYDYIIKGQEKEFQTGINVLKKLTEGNVHLNVNNETTVYNNTTGVVKNTVNGKHPAGNVGIQIHHIDPINKGEVVWYINPADVIIIGRLFEKGILDATKTIALTGSEVEVPQYYKVINGANIASLINETVKNENVRIISGNVLTGTKIEKDGYLSFYDYQITAIPEGNYHEFMGWAAPGFKKLSASRTFFTWLNSKKEYDVDTNYHGGERAFVMTGQYDKVFPMDILPVQLIKAIMIRDLELMEKLGIYEVVEEDFALCEFVCTSKIEVQAIVREGLDFMIKEMS